MKKQITYCIAFLTLLFTHTFYVNAQHPILTLNDGQDKNVDLGNIFDIDQDEQGFIWFASSTGLHRYDGHNYISYYHDPEDSTSLADNFVFSMCISKSGIIWLGTIYRGLDRFDPATQTFTHFQHNPDDTASISSNVINSLLEDNEGKLWVGAANGLNLYDPKNETFTRFQNIPGDATSLTNNNVSVIYQDTQNTIWVGTSRPRNINSTPEEEKEGGLNRFIPETGTFTRYQNDSENSNSLLNNGVVAILEDSRGNFWVGTRGDGLHTMNRETGTFTRHTYDPKHPNKISPAPRIDINKNGKDYVTFIHEDATGSIWIGASDSGLSRFDPNTNQTVHYNSEEENPIGLKDDMLFSAFTSQEGVLWMSALGHIGSFYTTDPLQRFEYVSTEGEPRSILEDNEGNLWVCTNKGLKVYKSIHAKARNTDLENQLPAQLKNDHSNQILQDAAGSIWIASENRLWRKDAKTGKFTLFSHDPTNANSISKGGISTLFLDSENILWVGTWRGELYRWEPKTKSFTHFLYDSIPSESIIRKTILSICEDSSGNLWIGGKNVLGKLNKNSGSFKQHATALKTIGLLSNINDTAITFDILLDSNGVLWLGTDRGLLFYNDTSDDFIIFKDAITGKQILNRVREINQDAQQNIWVNTDNELHRLNSKRALVTSYGSERGIDPSAFDSWLNANFNSNYVLKKDKIILSDETGFYSFIPQELKQNSTPPQVSFLDFYLFDKRVIPGPKSALTVPLNETEEIELAYDQNVFTLDFAAIHFTNPAKNQHLFMLENYDATWRDAEEEGIASYYSIPPGNYVFHIKAASSEGVWAEKSVHIVIHPPWYKTLWAYVLFALIFITGVWVVHISQRRRLLRAERARTQLKELEQAKEIKKAYDQLEITHSDLKSTQSQLIQSEKMASLGELTAGIAHEIQNPLNFVNNFSEVSEELLEELEEEINNNSKEGIDEIISDLKQNLNKINHHGERASSIVKGMLDHSRTSSGEKVLTDINVLADEYLRLSYHGLRAKDKTFNADFKTEFDENIPKIPIVPQDFGRVILNLINNAFYAVNKKGKEHPKDYKPTVTISTKKEGDAVFISIEDNGEGIPKNILDKIFQPFFTTKPTGEGTGLGLSLAYDIITKVHGGQLSVTSKKGFYTKFTIEIPTIKNK